MKNYDDIIIGSGTCGYRAAEILARSGRSVMIAEKSDKTGGVCLNRGCIPTKAYINVCEHIQSIKDMKRFGISATLDSIDMEKVHSFKNRTVKMVVRGLENKLKEKGIEIVRGEASIEGRGIIIDNEQYTCENIIIATGSRPKVLNGIEADGGFVLTSKDALDLTDIPPAIVIAGGGVIGVEMATVFAVLGSDVTVVEYMDSILPELGNALISQQTEKHLRKLKVKTVTGTGIESADRLSGIITLTDGTEQKADKLLLATGREPVIHQSFTKEGIETENGFIKTDSHKRTSIEHIYAGGDCTDGPMLAHRAYYDAEIIAGNILGNKREYDYSFMPYSVFTIPPSSSAGLTLDEIENRQDYVIYEKQYAANGRAAAMGKRDGLCRIITDSEGIIKGVTITGHESDSIIHELLPFIQFSRSIKDIGNTVHIHPTLSELIFEAVNDY